MDFTKCAWLYCLTGSLSLIANEDSGLVAKADPVQTKPAQNTTTLTVQPGSRVTIQSAVGSVPTSQLPDEAAPAMSTEDPSSKTIDGNTSAAPLAPGKAQFQFFADFLYWKRTDGIQFLADGLGFLVQTGVPPLDVPVAKRGAVYFPQFCFAPGFNVGLGVRLPYDGWDMKLSYLWLQNEGSRHFKRDPAKGWDLAPLFLNEILLQTEINRAHQKAEQGLNYFQMELGREFYTSKRLVLRPLIEIVGLYTPASLHTTYDYITSSPTIPKHVSYSAHAHGLGFGAGVGLGTKWNLSDHWSIAGDLKIDGVWDHFESKAQEKMTDLLTDQTIQNLLGELSFNKLLYLTNIFLGIDWHTNFHKDKCFMAAYAGWNFFSGLANYFIVSQGSVFSEQYSYQGLRAGLKFEF